MEDKYQVKANYFTLKKGKEVSRRDLSFCLQDNRHLWEGYAHKCGEPSHVTGYGFGFYSRPDVDKVFKTFLEDLLQTGVIEQINNRRKKR